MVHAVRPQLRHLRQSSTMLKRSGVLFSASLVTTEQLEPLALSAPYTTLSFIAGALLLSLVGTAAPAAAAAFSVRIAVGRLTGHSKTVHMQQLLRHL